MARKLPVHAQAFRGRAKNIPKKDVFMLPYQTRWIKDQSLLRIMEKARRIGISYSTAYDLVRDHSLASTTQDTWVSSRDEPTAKLFVQDCKKFARILKAAADDLGRRVMADDDGAAYTLHFANNTDINSVASNPDVFAGKGGNVILDEFALRRDPQGVYGIASPTIDWGGRLSIISTHRGANNYFNQIITEIREKNNPKGFSLHRVTLQDALDQGFLWKVQTKLRDGDPRLDMDEGDYWNYQRSRSASEEIFLQEYCCQPADEASAFLSYDLITSCSARGKDRMRADTEKTRDFVGKSGSIRKLTASTIPDYACVLGELYIGVDIGRDHDLTVIWLTAKIASVYVSLAVIELQGVMFSRQEHELYQLLQLPNVRRCCIDNTGIGKQLAERAQERFGTYRVEAVTFTAPVKESLAYPVRTAFEDKTVQIPDDDLIVADLRAIRKETTSAGNIRFSADSGENGHSDRFWALALALHAAGNDSGPAYAEVVKRTRANSRKDW